jgi:hypothetical protein
MKKVAYQAKNVRIFLAVLFVLAVLVTLKPVRFRPGDRWTWLAAEAALAAVFIALPKLFFPVYRIIMIGTGALGTFLFTLISLVVFFVVLTPIAVVQRLFGKSFMPVKAEPALPTYYEDVPETGDIEKQF